jgi:mannose-6-phosphate isomerase-like protein (cupin superfamily)
MKQKPLIVTPSCRNDALSVAGTNVTVLISSNESGSQQITLQSGQEGSGPPPHSHPWDESFFVTSGLVQFTCDGITTTCCAGTLVHVPAGTIHSFSYGVGGGEMLEVTGGASNSVRSFIALDREIPPGPVDVPKIVQVAGDYGVTFHL